MDIKKIIDLAHELQNIMPFSDGIHTKEQYDDAIMLMDELVEDAAKNELLIDYLFPIIERYEATAPEFAEFNKRMKVQMPSIFSDDLSLTTNMGEAQTGIEGALLYFSYAGDDYLRVAIDEAWEIGNKVFAVDFKGNWLCVKGSAYQTEQEVPAGYVEAVKALVRHNKDLFQEWRAYTGIEHNGYYFADRLKPVNINKYK